MHLLTEDLVISRHPLWGTVTTETHGLILNSRQLLVVKQCARILKQNAGIACDADVDVLKTVLCV